MFKREMQSAKKHITLANFAHFTGGFGLALLLQQYLLGDSFLPAIVGWLLVAFTLIVHIYILVS